jgi:hypothetical protein
VLYQLSYLGIPISVSRMVLRELVGDDGLEPPTFSV